MRLDRRTFLRLAGAGAMTGAGSLPALAAPPARTSFQTWPERSTANGVVLAVKFDDWAYWADPAKQHFLTGAHVAAPEQDRTIKPSGVGSCRFTIPSSGIASSGGMFAVNFTPRRPNYQRGHDYPVQFDAESRSLEFPKSAGKGVGHEFWAQFRWRCSRRYLSGYAADPPIGIRRVSSQGTTATVVTATPHGFTAFPNGVVVDGVTPPGYNTRGYPVPVTVLDPTTFTYTLAGGSLGEGAGGSVYRSTPGAKVSIVGEGDRRGHGAGSCTELELVITNAYYRATSQGGPGLPTAYHSCGGKDGAYEGLQSVRDGRIYIQNAVDCPWVGDPPYVQPVPPCVAYYPDEWLTWKYHVKIGHWYRGNIARGQVAAAGQPFHVVAANQIVRTRGSWVADGYAPGARLWLSNPDPPATSGVFTVKAVTESTLTLQESKLVPRRYAAIAAFPTVSMHRGAMTTQCPQTDGDFVAGGLPHRPGPVTEIQWVTRDGAAQTGYVVAKTSPTSWTVRDRNNGALPDVVDGHLKYVRRYWRDSTVEMWTGRDGQPLKKFVSRTDYDLANAGGIESAMYGKFMVVPYVNDRRDGVQTDPAYVWFDELIVSSADIADPVGTGSR